jgi:hypothetical protein
MTHCVGETIFSRFGLVCRGLGVVALLAAAAGCTRTNIEDIAPQSPGMVGPTNTGTFPNLNIPPQQAAEQFTEADRNAKLAQLKAEQEAAEAAARRTAGKPNAAELARLAKTHGSEALKEIEGKCDPALDPACE